MTKPYSDEQWAAIEALGHQVDADLKAHDVRLTMGGEPTFVSIDDMDGAEWNTHRAGTARSTNERTSCSGGCETASRRAACCITGKENGIRANRFRVGRWDFTGGKTASRYGAIRR